METAVGALVGVKVFDPGALNKVPVNAKY